MNNNILNNLQTQLNNLNSLKENLEKDKKKELEKFLRYLSQILKIYDRKNEKVDFDNLKNYLAKRKFYKFRIGIEDEKEKHLQNLISQLNLIILEIENKKTFDETSLNIMIEEIQFILKIDEEKQKEFLKLSNLNYEDKLNIENIPKDFLKFLKKYFDDKLLEHNFFPYKELYFIWKNTEKDINRLFENGLSSIIYATINKFENKREFIEFMNVLKI